MVVKRGETPTDSSTGMIGIVVGAYRIVRVLGHGGMGTVYLARSAHGEQVALKVLHRHLGYEKPHVDQFRREADAGAQFHHPAILRTLGAGQMADGNHYFAMEYFRGRTVAELLARSGSLTVRQAAVIAYRVATALDYAHQKGFLHRDIKPANVMLNRAGAVCVADFGLAHLFGDQSGGEAGMFLGTPAYCPPEQLRSQPLDPRTDVYALGVTLYEMLAGEPPFAGAMPLEVLESIMDGRGVPLGDRRDDVPPDLLALLDVMLAPVADRRPADAHDVVERLAEYLRESFPDADTPAAFEEALAREARAVFLGTIEVDTLNPLMEQTTRPDPEAGREGSAGPVTPATAAEPLTEPTLQQTGLPDGPGVADAGGRAAVDPPAEEVAAAVAPGPSWVVRHANAVVAAALLLFVLGGWALNLQLRVGVPVIVGLLEADSAGKQALAQRGLRLLGANAVAPVVAALGTAPAPQRRRLYAALRELATPAAGAALIAAAGDRDPRVRADAVAGATAADHPRAVELCLAALADPDPEVRAAGVEGLLRDPKPQYLPALAAAYREADANLRGVVTHAIAEYGASAVPHLRRVWTQLDPEGRRAVVECAVRIGGPAASRMLVDRVDEPDIAVRFQIVEALQRLSGTDIGDDPAAWRAWARAYLTDAAPAPPGAE